VEVSDDAPRPDQVVREELVRVDAELASIPTDRFAERSALLRRRGQLVAELRAATPIDAETSARWAERAASKGDRARSTPFIESRIESGSM